MRRYPRATADLETGVTGLNRLRKNSLKEAVRYGSTRQGLKCVRENSVRGQKRRLGRVRDQSLPHDCASIDSLKAAALSDLGTKSLLRRVLTHTLRPALVVRASSARVNSCARNKPTAAMLRFAVSHPRRKNKDVPKVGHPAFHPSQSDSPVADCFKASLTLLSE